jgi:hypothetical protein
VLRPGGNLLISTPSALASTFWKSIVWLPGILMRHLRKGAVFQKQSAYEVPLYARTLGAMLNLIGFKVLVFEKAVLLLHESCYPHLPEPVAAVSVRIANFVELKLKLLGFARLHCLVRCEK